MAALVATTLTTNTVVQALFDSLIEKLVVRVSTDIPSIIEKSIQQYAMDSLYNNDGAIPNMKHHGLLLKELNDTGTATKKVKTANGDPEKKPPNNSDLYFCNSVLKLVDERLKALEVLQISELNVALSHLSDAKHALNINNIKRFRYFIQQSYLKSREALYKITNIKYLLHKVYCYSVIIFTGFFIFSEFGNNLHDGLSFIHKVSKEIQSDVMLNDRLNGSLNGYYWNKFDRILVSHCCLFSCKLSSLIRAIHHKIKTQQPHGPKKMKDPAAEREAKQLKQLFGDIQNNCTVIKDMKRNTKQLQSSNEKKQNDDNDIDDEDEDNLDDDDDDDADDYKMEDYNKLIEDMDSWMPCIWTGHFFGTNRNHHRSNKAKNQVVVAPKHYLSLFQVDKVAEADNLWFCESTGFIYEYFAENKVWLNTVTDSLLYEYYYHFIFKQQKEIERQQRISKTFNLTAFNDHFGKYVHEKNRLMIRKQWQSMHPKLKLLLKHSLTLRPDTTANNLAFITVLDLGYNEDRFGLEGMKYVCNITNVHHSSLRVLKLAKNNLDFQCVQLFVISLFSILPKRTNYSKLIEINFSYNTEIGDDSLYLLLMKGIALRCPHLKSLYVQWTNIGDLSCKYLTKFYEENKYHSLARIYFNGNKRITTDGACVLNALLQGLCFNRKEISINISDCMLYLSQIVKFDQRLIIG